jgi:hypothetical protein
MARPEVCLPMPARLCPRGHVTRARTCPVCETLRDRGRGTRQARGYGSEHMAARASLRGTLPAPCGYGCGTTLYPNGDWVAAHMVDGDPSAGWLASCRTCNERAKHRG